VSEMTCETVWAILGSNGDLSGVNDKCGSWSGLHTPAELRIWSR
jgi:hypothetical protein